MSGLDLRKRHGALRSNLEAERIDLGNEPPLSVDGETSGLVDRRRVSVQWFSGTVLTGLCGAALMSGAVFAALDGETNFATVPERVEAAVREAANWDGNLAQRPAVLASALPTTLAAYAPERNGDPYAGFEPRIVPENVSLLPKTTSQMTGGNAWNERTVVLKKGDSVSAFLREMGATADQVRAITTAFGGRGKDSSPRDGYKLRVLLAPASDGIRLRPVRVVIATDAAVEAMVAWSEMGKYVAVDVRRANSVASSGNDDDDDGKGVRLYQSIYETALRNHVPRPVIDDFIRIYSYDVDFQRKVQPGDSFEVLFAGA